MFRPVIGITVDAQQPSSKLQCAPAYVQAVMRGGGLPFLLTHETALIDDYLRFCDGFLFTGGDDPAMEVFGEPTHPAANLTAPQRQAFELALLAALDNAPKKPVLGICMGMQLMALTHEGKLNQHLPDTLGQAAACHAGNNHHAVRWTKAWRDSQWGDKASFATDAMVVSSHHQAILDAGRLTVLAMAADGVIEAVVDLHRQYYVGVQWHPERGGTAGDAFWFTALAKAAADARGSTAAGPPRP